MTVVPALKELTVCWGQETQKLTTTDRMLLLRQKNGSTGYRGAQRQKESTAWEIRKGVPEEMPLELGLEGRVGVR